MSSTVRGVPFHAVAQLEGIGVRPLIIGEALGEFGNRLALGVVLHQAGKNDCGQFLMVVEQGVDGVLVFPGVDKGVRHFVGGVGGH